MNRTLSPDPDARFAEWSGRIRDSDQTALAALFRACFGDLRRYARSFGADESTADDLVQESFIRLWNRRKSVDPARSVRAYLCVTIRNLALNDERRIRTRERIHSGMTPPVNAPTPDLMADAHLLQSRLQDWIRDLPERRREAFVLSRFAGLSLHEIAAVMNVSAKTVEQHITHSLKELRRRLHELDPDLLKP